MTVFGIPRQRTLVRPGKTTYSDKQVVKARVKTDAPVTLRQNGTSSRSEPDADGYINIAPACGEGVFREIGN